MNAQFYFANLGADVARCISAAERGDEKRYQDSLERAYETLALVRAAHRPEAYEEGQLMLRGLEYARADNKLSEFSTNINALVASYAPRLQ